MCRLRAWVLAPPCFLHHKIVWALCHEQAVLDFQRGAENCPYDCKHQRVRTGCVVLLAETQPPNGRNLHREPAFWGRETIMTCAKNENAGTGPGFHEEDPLAFDEGVSRGRQKTY